MANGIPLNPMLSGYRTAKKDIQEEQAFEVDMAAAQQELYSKSLQIQDFIDAGEFRSTERRVKTKQLEADERLLPQQEATKAEQLRTDKATAIAQRVQNNIKTETMKMEDRARPLFGINPENYNDMIGQLDPALMTDLGLTGQGWAEDGPKIQMARRMAIDSASHMRAVELATAKNKGKGSNLKATTTRIAKRDQEAVHTMLADDNIYKELKDEDKMTYRSRITSLAMDLRQRNLDAFRNGEADTIIPYTSWVDQVKQIADKHVTKSDSILSYISDQDEFNQEGFDAEIGATYGIAPSKELLAGLEAAGGEGGSMPRITTRQLTTAADTIMGAREQQGIPNSVSDQEIFQRLLAVGYINEDGTLKGGE